MESLANRLLNATGTGVEIEVMARSGARRASGNVETEADPGRRGLHRVIEESGVRRNFATLLAGDLVNRLLRFVATIALARALTLQGFGLVNTAVAVSGVVVVLTTFGLSKVGARDIAVVPARARPLMRRVAAVRSAAAALVLLASLGTALLLAPGYAGLTLAAGVMALGMSASGEWALRGLERMRRLAVAWIAGGATVAAGSVGLALAGGGPVLAVWVWALGELVVAFLTWRAVRRTAPSEESVEGPRALIRRAWPVGAAGVIATGIPPTSTQSYSR